MERLIIFTLLFLSLFTSQTALSSSSPQATSSSSPSHSASLPPIPLVKYVSPSGKNDFREFFLKEDFHHDMEILFPISPLFTITSVAHVAKKPDFPTKEMPTILNKFDLKPNSSQAQALNDNMMSCKVAPLPTKKKCCMTSIERMLKFMVFRKELVVTDVVSCHKLVFPFSLFLCHSFSHTKTYRVQLMAFQLLGVKLRDKTICHTNTINSLVWGLPI
ncbi:hypothetical protein SLA2020_333270 [Shorea laevis]